MMTYDNSFVNRQKKLFAECTVKFRFCSSIQSKLIHIVFVTIELMMIFCKFDESDQAAIDRHSDERKSKTILDEQVNRAHL